MLICEFDELDIENLSNQKLEFTVFLNIDYIHSNLIRIISKNIQNKVYPIDDNNILNDENTIKKIIKLNLDDLISITKNIDENENS